MLTTSMRETQPAEHVARFWDLLRNNHVRILVDMRREIGHDAPDGPSVYWDGSSFGDDTARMLLAEHDRSLHLPEPQTAPDTSEKFWLILREPGAPRLDREKVKALIQWVEETLLDPFDWTGTGDSFSASLYERRTREKWKELADAIMRETR